MTTVNTRRTSRQTAEPAPAAVELNLRTYKRAVYETLRDMIVSFEFEPGERLVETELAARLNVSKTPVREALSMLETDGLVDVAPYRGATVRWLSTMEMEEQGFLVDALEMPAYPLVVERITDEDLSEIARLTADLVKARKKGDERAFMTVAPEIHYRIFRATGFPRLRELIRIVIGPAGLRYDKALVYPDPEAWDLLLALSVARVEAIEARDAARAIEDVRARRLALRERTFARLSDPAVARYFRNE